MNELNESEVLAAVKVRTVDFVSDAELQAKLKKAAEEGRSLRIKLGADPSAPDLHLGHVVVLNKLREWQDLGHTVVFIIGDFTAMIGDPSGRSKTRPPLTKEEVQAHAETYKEQVFKILDESKTEIRFNSEWCAALTFEDVIRLSSRVTVAQMLTRDDFSKRYAENAPISLVEFMYPLVQAYDSVMIDADVEVGGTDQLFNLLLGRELQKSFGKEPQIVMTLPLLEGLDGVKKMSKSLGNYIGITEPPKEIFGKAMSVSDELMWKYYSLVLGCPEEEVVTLRRKVESGERHPRQVKDELAQQLVARFYDDEEARNASEGFAKVFAQNELPNEMPEIQLADLETDNGRMGLLTLLVQCALAGSNSEARRLIQQGGVRIDEEKITDPKAQISPKSGMILQVGKRRFAKLI